MGKFCSANQLILSEVGVKYLLRLSSMSNRIVFPLVVHILNMHIPFQVAYWCI